jgi:streptogramin lyase
VPAAVLPVAIVAAVFWLGTPAASQAPGGVLGGTVKGADGQAMEGVTISAKAAGSTITTSVWTDRGGQYSFPPLPNGQYRVWAQAVGFAREAGDQALASGQKASRDFTMKPVQNFVRQLSDVEWLNSLPDLTPEDRGVPGRMKRILINTCSTCHQPGFVLEKRFDRAGWEIIVNHMGKLIAQGDPAERPGGGKYDPPVLDATGKPMGVQQQLFEYRKQDIISYLTRVAGPEPMAITPKPFPRPTGEATRIVVTEYDVTGNRSLVGRLDPRTGRTQRYSYKDGETIIEETPPPYNQYRLGEDWFLATRSDEQEGGTIHDVALGTDGNIYYSGIGSTDDPSGAIWFGTLYRLDIATQKLRFYPRPQGLGGGFANGKQVDSKGFLWGSQPNGLFKVDPKTGEYKEYKAVTPFGRTYDMVIDRDERVWFHQLGADRIGVVDSRTDDISEIALPPLNEPMLPADAANDKRAGGGWNMVASLYQKGPRRMGVDANGDDLYSGYYWAGKVARTNIRTRQMKEYDLPDGRYIHPYKIVVDRNHMAYITAANGDVFFKFNPETEQFTRYPLPSRGSNSRHMIVDHSGERPVLWIPYTGAQKIAKVEFR